MRTVAPALLLLTLAACAQGEPEVRAREIDPASEQALGDPIMVDPDLAGMNEGNAALTVSSDHSLPLIVATPEAIAAARAEAALLIGEADHPVAIPEATRLRNVRGDPLTLAQSASALPGTEQCVSALDYSAAWAARLPEALPVYPRAATLDAAGTDVDACRLRAANFATPVPLEDVLAFYAARARRSGFAIAHAANATTTVLSGQRRGSAFRLELRSREDGLTEANLATRGL